MHSKWMRSRKGWVSGMHINMVNMLARVSFMFPYVYPLTIIPMYFAHKFRTLLCCVRKHAQRLCRKCGVLLTQNSKPGRHLPFHHPQMEKVRTWVNYQIASGAVNGQLLANFDQVWSLLYRPASRTLRQSSSVPGQHSKEPSLRKIRHCIQRVMDLPLTESFEPKPSDGIRQVQGGPAGHSPVESYRIPRTLTTLSWADGAMGRGFVTCKSDHMSEKDRNQANQAGQLDINCFSIYRCFEGSWIDQAWFPSGQYFVHLECVYHCSQAGYC